MRHLNHLDFLCEDDAKHCADCKADVDCPHGADAVVEDGEDDCNQHTKCADSVADFAVLNFAHESDAHQDAQGKNDGESKICPLSVCAHQSHSACRCNKTTGDDDGDDINDGLTFCLVLCNHTEHSVSDHKSAHHVDHGKGNGD